MNVELKLFSVAKELAGFEERTIQLVEHARAGDVLPYLARVNPKFAEWERSFRLAVNLEYVNNNHPLEDGDEVAVIPPVSGG
jgi:molybdopterin synthase sulfur carrier subunit